MDVDSEVVVVQVERLSEGVAIAFSDGRSAVYSATLLLSMIDQAEDKDVPDPGNE
jgi:hypothetical protein